MTKALCNFDSRVQQFHPVIEKNARENREEIIFKIFQAVSSTQTEQIPTSSMPDCIYRISLNEDHNEKLEISIYMELSEGSL